MPGISSLGKDNCKTRRETFKFRILVCVILEIWQYVGKASYWCRQVPENLHIQCWRKKISRHCTLSGQGNECHTCDKTQDIETRLVHYMSLCTPNEISEWIYLNRSALSPEICCFIVLFPAVNQWPDGTQFITWTNVDWCLVASKCSRYIFFENYWFKITATSLSGFMS